MEQLFEEQCLAAASRERWLDVHINGSVVPFRAFRAESWYMGALEVQRLREVVSR